MDKRNCKTLLARVLTPLLLAGVLGACPACRPAGQTPSSQPGRLKVLASTFPMLLFTQAVVGDSARADVDLMIPAEAGCPHDYQLTPQDMLKISSADVFVANGLGLEEFLGTPLRQARSDVKLINASEGFGQEMKFAAFEEAGNQAQEHQGDINPHMFASPKMAALIVRNIARQLGQIDPAGAQQYQRNADAAAARLEKLAGDLAAAVAEFPSPKIVTQHAVFDYLARDSGLEIVAVVEEAPGQEPSPANMIRLAGAIRRAGARALFVEPQYPDKVGRTLAADAGIAAATLDPVATGPAGAGFDYYEQTMRRNLQTLKQVLGGP